MVGDYVVSSKYYNNKLYHTFLVAVPLVELIVLEENGEKALHSSMFHCLPFRNFVTGLRYVIKRSSFLFFFCCVPEVTTSLLLVD